MALFEVTQRVDLKHFERVRNLLLRSSIRSCHFCAESVSANIIALEAFYS
jgi:hypothetical protein